jgi:hypothetical protein
MGNEIFYILQKKSRRLLFCNDPSHIEKQSPLRSTLETMRTTERVFFAYSGNRKRLTGEPCKKYVVIGNILCVDLCNVSLDLMILSKVFDIRFCRPWTPFACEDAFSSCLLETKTDSTYPSEQINESEILLTTASTFSRKSLPKSWNNQCRWANLTLFPPTNCARVPS